MADSNPAALDLECTAILLADAAATERLGAELARVLDAFEGGTNDGAYPRPREAPPPLIVHLRGDLGAGKTTLVRGFLRALGWAGAVRSPSYTLLEPYDLPPRHCIHVDLYRLTAPAELEDLGLRDYLTASHVLLIEWPERGGPHTPPAQLDIHLEFEGDRRRATLRRAATVLQRFELASLSI